MVFDPSAGTCSSQSYAFHPMYASSSPHTRVPWAAHSYNIAFADEIGHWEYCAKADLNGNCISGGDSDSDDQFCSNASASSRIKVGGCTQTEFDFDGVCYQDNWPGTNPATDKKMHPHPILFTSPLLAPATGGAFQNYTSAAQEADLPIIEANSGVSFCDVFTGSNCTNPPPNANFYPFFSTVGVGNLCEWGLGGAQLPGATNTFGGSSTTAFGSLYPLIYNDSSGSYTQFNNYQNALGSNPCQAPAANLQVPSAPVAFGTRAKGSPSPAKKLSIVNQSPYPIALATSGCKVAPPPDGGITNNGTIRR